MVFSLLWRPHTWRESPRSQCDKRRQPSACISPTAGSYRSYQDFCFLHVKHAWWIQPCINTFQQFPFISGCRLNMHAMQLFSGVLHITTTITPDPVHCFYAGEAWWAGWAQVYQLQPPHAPSHWTFCLKVNRRALPMESARSSWWVYEGSKKDMFKVA